MKKLLFLFLVMCSVSGFAQTTGIKFSELLTYTGSSTDVYAPVTIKVGTQWYNRKMPVSMFNSDSVLLSHDSLFAYRNGSTRFVGKIVVDTTGISNRINGKVDSVVFRSSAATDTIKSCKAGVCTVVGLIQRLDTISVDPVIGVLHIGDSVRVTYLSGTIYKYKDSTGGGGTSTDTTNLSARVTSTVTAVNNLQSTKLNITDTAGLSSRITGNVTAINALRNVKVDSVTFSSSPFVDTVFYWISGVKALAGYVDHHEGLLSGGVVTWVSGLTFNVSPAVYTINETRYSSPGGQVTLNAADPTNPRIDVIAVNSSGAVVKITGTAASNPAEPQADPSSQRALTSVNIAAGATTPTGVTQKIVYDENTGTPTEFATGTSGTITANFNNSTPVYNGSKSLAVTAYSLGSTVNFTNNTALSFTNYGSLSFQLRLTAAMAKNQNLTVQFFKAGVAVSSAQTAAFDKTITGAWQTVSFTTGSFTTTSSTFDAVKFAFASAGSSTLYIDYVSLQAGITQVYTPAAMDTSFLHQQIVDLRARRDTLAITRPSSNTVIFSQPTILKSDTVTLSITEADPLSVHLTDSATMLTNYRHWTQGYLKNITSYVSAGTNISLSGLGTLASPYVITGTGGAGGGLSDSTYFWQRTGNVATYGNFFGTINNLSLRFRTNNTEYLKLDSLGRFYTEYGTNSVYVLAGTSAPTANSGVVAIGAVGGTPQVNSINIGNGATTSGGSGGSSIGYQAISSAGGWAGGYQANATGAEAIHLTTNAGISSGQYDVNIGSLTRVTGVTATGIGRSDTVAAQSGIGIGSNINIPSTHTYSMAFGEGTKTTAARQFVAGSMNGFISDVYFGSGPQGDTRTTSIGRDYTIHGSGATGTDQVGGHLTLAGGLGAGAGTPGDVIISTGTAGASGTTLQSLTPRITVKSGTGQLILNSVSQLPTYADETAATTAGLLSGTFYKSSDGIVRIKL